MGIAPWSAVGSHCSLPTAISFCKLSSEELSPGKDRRSFVLSGKDNPTCKEMHLTRSIIPIAVVCFAGVLRLWSTAETNGGGLPRLGETTGSAYTRPNEMLVVADSGRTLILRSTTAGGRSSTK
jgi:hypothetical protein